jgi:Zn-dependent M28 family amino/carboxypeptidase
MRGGFGEPASLRLPSANAQPRLQLQYFTIQPDMASAILGGGLTEQGVRDLEASLSANPRNFSPRAVSARLSVNAITNDEPFPGRNVAALLPGSDPELAHEVVVLVAHYDHVGVGAADATGDRIYNGADDNGSGTVGLMALANALNEAKKAGVGPRRSVLFLHVTGEEKGLLGSRYYSDNPTIPMANTIANINVDMIGRIEAKRYESGDTNYVYLIGASLISSKVDSLVRAANAKTVNIFLDPGLNDLNDPQQIYRRSDHWNFGRLGVPFAFFFSGLHDDYHLPSDSPDKITYEAMADRLKVIYGATIELANDTERPVVDNEAFIQRTQASPR